MKCDNCGKEASNRMFSDNRLLSETETSIANYYSLEKKNSFCLSCKGSSIRENEIRIQTDLKDAKKEYTIALERIPIVTLHNPAGWDYEIVGIVTAQSVVGTGLATEFASAFTDLLGMESQRHNNKLRECEQTSFNLLRKNAAELGCNAVIATGLNYAEVGGVKGMLLVAAFGTAIKLKASQTNMNIPSILAVQSISCKIKLLSDLNTGILNEQ